jgi:hypothetical protein
MQEPYNETKHTDHPDDSPRRRELRVIIADYEPGQEVTEEWLAEAEREYYEWQAVQAKEQADVSPDDQGALREGDPEYVEAEHEYYTWQASKADEQIAAALEQQDWNSCGQALDNKIFALEELQRIDGKRLRDMEAEMREARKADLKTALQFTVPLWRAPAQVRPRTSHVARRATPTRGSPSSDDPGGDEPCDPPPDRYPGAKLVLILRSGPLRYLRDRRTARRIADEVFGGGA